MNERWVPLNRQEYGERYPLLTFPTPRQSEAAEARRRELIAAVSDRAEIGCGGTKLDCRRLAPGCAICVAGGWSCLFINGKCNARCFYCPSSQDEIGRPVTNTLEFRSPGDYVDYLAAFGFTGVSFSGGEPLLTPERTLAYLRAVKRRFGAGLHTWLYTNGTLATPGMLGRLADAGLDEIRFDIGAAGYRLEPAVGAVGVIPTVTVEIPAVPEKEELLRLRIAEMAAAGIAHLNLHQLRLTPYNFERFQGRGYTFLHGEKVTVLESELTALGLIHDTLERGIDLPVNYCSFLYKNRYQRLAARRRNAAFVRRETEDLTAAGYLRGVTLAGEPGTLARQVARLEAEGTPVGNFARNAAGDRLSLRGDLLARLELEGLRLLVGYAAAVQTPGVSYRNAFVQVPVNARVKIVIERQPVSAELELAGDARAAWLGALRGEGGRLPEAVERFERLEEGLGAY